MKLGGVVLACALVGLAFGLGLGCQTYDFQPVVPFALAAQSKTYVVGATGLKPNLMLLVDRSGSMSDPVDPTCTSNCISKITQLKSTMQGFTSTYPTVARMGVIWFAADNGCGVPQLTDIPTKGSDVPQSDDNATLTQAANQVNSVIQSLAAGGGTPTAGSLTMLASYNLLTQTNPGRGKFVLLMTDGIPNCNQANPNNSCTTINPACQCTTGSGTCQPGLSTCSTGCLDADATVAAIKGLGQVGVRTIVIGFGADTLSGVGPTTLNAMASAGGFARTCPNGTDAECQAGGNPSDTCVLPQKVCQFQYYQASTGAQLGQALANIVTRLPSSCAWQLDTVPSDPSLLAVDVNGVNVPPGPNTWTYASGIVTFAASSTICQQLQSGQQMSLAFHVANVI